MKMHTVLFCSTLVISNSNAMEIIKKFKPNHKPHKTKESSIITDFLFTQRMITQHGFLKDIATQIRQFCIQTREKDVKNNHPYNNNIGQDTWNHFGIPIFYLYYLTPQQGDCLQKYFTYAITHDYPKEQRVDMIYTLPSKEDYEIFKTIPIAIRRYLTRMPEADYKTFGYPLTDINYPNTDINKYKILRIGDEYKIKKNFIIYKEKSIVHEEKVKKIKLEVRQIRTPCNHD